MSNVFTSRQAAREAANAEGMKVVDRGSHVSDGRWMVVPKTSHGASKPPKVDMSFTSEATPSQTSMFFSSRGDARSFAKGKKNAKIIDHAKTSAGQDKHDSAVKDLGKRGKRWEVVFETVDLHIDATILLTPEPHHIPVNINWVEVDRDEEEEAAEVVEGEAEEQEPVVIMTTANVCISMPSGHQYTVNRDSEIFQEVGMLLIAGDIDGAVALICSAQESKATSGVDLGPDLKLIDGELYWHGQKQQSSLAKRIIDDIEKGAFDQRYVNFMQKLMHNPSYASVKMLYDFIQHNDLQIMENGDVKAYKKIKKTEDGPRDSYTGKVPNYKGQIISMPRNMVEDNPSLTCSQGLHVASLDYAWGFGGNALIEVAVNPADVVSVPYDYDHQKCRCCRYEILTGTEKPVGAPDILVIGAAGQIIDSVYLEEETKED